MQLQEKDPAVEDKFYLEYNLDIKTLRERGKYHDRYRMVMTSDDKIQEFELIEQNCNAVVSQGKITPSTANEKASPVSTATTDNDD